jgi:hypothetical protein
MVVYVKYQDFAEMFCVWNIFMVFQPQTVAAYNTVLILLAIKLKQFFLWDEIITIILLRQRRIITW